ncbi:hypothetical protein pdam_00016461 [Pocillopora damicornis]|uniref:G-protein coupled receptors family 1 profile domain-containing protein n=1 Tax=Pocillopora damicornis TaxID=46731 RepID=A0A3M6TQR9_POCDA|nr:hypothetical protein pdam_00016461 [Pocillopora damicornis]
MDNWVYDVYVSDCLENRNTTINFYFKLPYIGPFSVVTQKRVRQFAKCYCNSIDIKLVFSSFKIGNMFGVKDPIPRGLPMIYGACLRLLFTCFRNVHIQIAVLVLFLANSLVNPIIYALRMPEFREGLIQLVYRVPNLSRIAPANLPLRNLRRA